ncbi:hypothetical protein KI387_020088 [Taxus chinensis]|uniref:Uncharacterized protein n=1 Tax=Taxus chinensis TaxID=29808 RepID=A0AA38LAS3_TAXCH|nr:hypothetical protein KI387_020088 [Taxus chinensis]
MGQKDANRPVRPKWEISALCQMGQRDARDADRRRSRKPIKQRHVSSAESGQGSPFRADRRFMSQTVWDIRDKKMRRVQKSRQGRGPINA